jgi:WXXGXW repeat (2 copies)
MRNLVRALTATLLLVALPLAANADVFVSVSFGPPLLPVYAAPPMPAPGYFWVPGYWGYADDGYYWVPGTWVLAPEPGLLWTPGYWGWAGGLYVWHGGYWGPHVGFYGGINYGFGYSGVGFHGGEWEGGRFVANTTVINNTTIVNNTTINRVSYNGGSGGVAASPTAVEMRAAREHHVAPSEVQQQHQLAASRDTTMRAAYNHGNPSVAATAKAGVFYGKGVVAARSTFAPTRPPTHEQSGGRNAGSQAPRNYAGTTPPRAHDNYAGAGQPGAHRNYAEQGQAHGNYPAAGQPAAHGNYAGAGQARGNYPQAGQPAARGSYPGAAQPTYHGNSSAPRGAYPGGQGGQGSQGGPRGGAAGNAHPAPERGGERPEHGGGHGG